MGDDLLKSSFVARRDLLSGVAKNLDVAKLCAGTRGRQRVLRWFSRAGEDVLQERIGQGKLRMDQREQCLNFFGHVNEGGRDSRFELRRCFSAIAALQFVSTSSQDESLLGSESPFLCGNSHAVPKLLAREQEVALRSRFSHERVLLTCSAFSRHQ